jgi:hypothetical protein
MDEEMVALDAKGQENNWVQMGVQSQTQCKWICE